MKKAIKLTLAVVFVMGATSLFAQKFGRINTQEVISVMPEMKEMQTNIEAYSKDLQESMENIVVEYNNKYQEFNKNFSTMSDAVRQLKEKELNDLIQRRNDFEQVAQQISRSVTTSCWPRSSTRPRLLSTRSQALAATWQSSIPRRGRWPISMRPC